MKSPLRFLPVLFLCGCLADSAAQSRPAEFIEFGPSPRTPAVEPSSQAPAGATPQSKIVNREAGSVEVAGGEQDAPTAVYLYTAAWCGPCQMHKAYWEARGNKGDGFVVIVENAPSWCAVIPTYHWKGKVTAAYPSGWKHIASLGPEQFQSAFDQGEK